MSTAVAEQQIKKPQANERIVEYTPLGGKTPVQLTIGMVRSFLCTPTKNGNQASDADIVKFMMLCKARELDPWVGDAYLTGFDSQDGPQFSLITAAQALLKRAEMNEFYDGMESGVIVKGDGPVEFRAGDLVLDGETLVGGWARCFRKDRSHPSYDALKLSTFDTKRSRWSKDPAGMIVKCAESSVLRKAFPTQLGGLYTREEMDQISDRRMDSRDTGAVLPSVKGSGLDALTQQLTQAQPETKTLAPPPQTANTDVQAEAQTEPDDGLLKWEAMVDEAGTEIELGSVEEVVKKSTTLTADQKVTVVGWINKRRKALK